ncbi:MAG: Crp/Fnr family transcriptional regulator [Phenylobacterium sp.]|nr:Crp/Fnr family transcriptional regulator [Phenylobacterium sp.]
MSPDDRILAETCLRRAEWLRQGGPELVDAFLAHGRIVALGPGQWVQAEGDDEAGVLVLLDGALQLYCQAPGDREVLIGQLPPGAALGQTTRFGGGPRLVTAICRTESRLLQVSDRALGRIAQTTPRVWEAVSALLYLQLRNLLEMVAELTAMPPRERLARRLELMSRGSTDGTVHATQQALGEMVGLTRKTANAHLGEFERMGLIRRSYGALTILDPAGLRRAAGG